MIEFWCWWSTRTPKWWQSSTWLRFPASSIRSSCHHVYHYIMSVRYSCYHFNVNTATNVTSHCCCCQFAILHPNLIVSLLKRELSDSLVTVFTSLGRKDEWRENWNFSTQKAVFLFIKGKWPLNVSFKALHWRVLLVDPKGQWRLIIVALLLKPGFMQ